RIVAASIFARFNPPAYEALKGKDLPVLEGHELSYSVANQLHELFREERGYDVGLWRSVGAGYTKFAIESFIDEIARAQAIDPVLAILPDNIVAQIEGATTFGVSHALLERITVRNGAVQQSNFHDYPLLRMADTPDIQVRVISTDNPPGGIGEVGLPPVAPAIANAVAALTGVRVRQLPMLP